MTILFVILYLWFNLAAVMLHRLNESKSKWVDILLVIAFPIYVLELNKERIARYLSRLLDRLAIRFINLIDTLRGEI